MNRRLLLACARAACAVALSACAALETARPPAAAPPAPPAPPAAAPRVEEPVPAADQAPRVHGAEARERAAHSFEARGDLARALTQWKLVGLLEPDNPEWRRRTAELRRRIDEKVAGWLSAGEAAWTAGDAKGAREAFLEALALNPREKGAAQRLREIETREIQLREQAKLDKASSKARTGDRASMPRPAADNQAAYYLETGIELYRQGDYEKCVVELEKYLGSFPDEPKARKYLADARVRLGEAALKAGDTKGAIRQFEAAKKGGGDTKQVNAYLHQAKQKVADDLYDLGVKASRTDLDKAIDYWKECLSYDPDHVSARVQLDKAVKMRERLKTVR